MKRLNTVLACLACLLVITGCQGADSSSAAPAADTSVPSSSSAGEVLPGVEVPEKVDAFNSKSDLPEGCNGLEIYGFGYDEEADIGYFICRAMDFMPENAVYLGEETYVFKLQHIPSVMMWDYLIAGYDGLSSFQDEGSLAYYYTKVVEDMGYFPALRAYYDFANEDEIKYLQDAFYTPSNVDITTGEPIG